jgi:hypothetical protein
MAFILIMFVCVCWCVCEREGGFEMGGRGLFKRGFFLEILLKITEIFREAFR